MKTGLKIKNSDFDIREFLVIFLNFDIFFHSTATIINTIFYLDDFWMKKDKNHEKSMIK